MKAVICITVLPAYFLSCSLPFINSLPNSACKLVVKQHIQLVTYVLVAGRCFVLVLLKVEGIPPLAAGDWLIDPALTDASGFLLSNCVEDKQDFVASAVTQSGRVGSVLVTDIIFWRSQIARHLLIRILRHC